MNCPNDGSPLVPQGLGHRAVLVCVSSQHVVATAPEHVLVHSGGTLVTMPLHAKHDGRGHMPLPGFAMPVRGDLLRCMECGQRAEVWWTDSSQRVYAIRPVR